MLKFSHIIFPGLTGIRCLIYYLVIYPLLYLKSLKICYTSYQLFEVINSLDWESVHWYLKVNTNIWKTIERCSQSKINLNKLIGIIIFLFIILIFSFCSIYSFRKHWPNLDWLLYLMVMLPKLGGRPQGRKKIYLKEKIKNIILSATSKTTNKMNLMF